MAVDCKLETVKKYQDMSEDAIEALEKEIARLENIYGGDNRQARAEMSEIIGNFIENEKYNSINVIRNKMKTAAIQKKVITDDINSTVDNLLDFFEGDAGIENVYHGYQNTYNSMVRTGMIDSKFGNIDKEFVSGEFDALIRQQAHNKANGKPDVDNAKAVEMYNILKKTSDHVHADMRAAGLHMRYRRDFLVSRDYNAEKLVDAGKPHFVQVMKEKYLNLEETFSPSVMKEGDARIDQILGDVFDEIIETRTTWMPKEMIGKSNAFDKLRGRKFEFIDGAVEHEFAQEFGNGKTLAEAVDYQMDRSAKTVANVQTMGTDAEKVYKHVMKEVNEKFAGKVPSNEIKAKLDKVNIAYHEVVAPPHSAVTTVHKAINAVRGLQAFTKLGSSIFAAAFDLNSTALQHAIHTNGNQFNGYITSFKNFLKAANLDQAQKAELSNILAVNTWFNDAAVILGGHKGDYDTGFDKLNRFFTGMQKWTGVPWQTGRSRLTNGLNQVQAFNGMLDNLDNLTNFEKLAVKKHGFSMDELKFIKDNAKRTVFGGDDLGVTPRDILEIPSDVFDSNPVLARRMKNELYTKYGTYIDSVVQKGTPTPGARVKRHLFKDRSRDANVRAVSSLIMQFKETAWQILLANRDALNTYRNAQGVGGAAMGVSQYMMLGMISYMGIEEMKAALFNQEGPMEKLRNGDKESLRKFWMEYATKSAIAPVLMDAVDQGTSPYFGNNITNYVAGPFFGGMAPDAFNMVRSNKKGKAARRFAKRHLLPSNHFAIKSAIRHGFNSDIITGDKIRK